MSPHAHKSVFFLMGPTASGKTALAMELVRQLPLQIISVDSTMVYRGMDIGTAKPSLVEQSAAPHRLIDICDPSERYTAGQYYHDALVAIDNAHAQGFYPLCVGGSMLYFNLLRQGLTKLPAADDELRDRLQSEVAQHGCGYLHDQLSQVDPLSAKNIKPQDIRRTIRALEVWHLTGQAMSQLHAEALSPIADQIKSIALLPQHRAELDALMHARIEQMFADGLLAEVARLQQNPALNADLPAMQAVGYRQLWDPDARAQPEDELKQRVFLATRSLAKHQMTWLKRWDVDLSLDFTAPDKLNQALDYMSSMIEREA